MKMPEFRRGSIRIVYCIITGTAVCLFSAAAQTVLVAAPPGMIYKEVSSGLAGELGTSFTIRYMSIDSTFVPKDFNAQFIGNMPSVIILMGNKSIRFYKQFVPMCSEKVKAVPVITLVASQMEQAIDGLDNVRGIAYDPPMITALINFRTIINRPIKKVGIVYREIFGAYVKQHTEYCRKEKITVSSILISNDMTTHAQELTKALQQLLRKDNVDVFWVPNDNVLLKPELLGNIWIPTFQKNRVPVIVGVESLVKCELDFGTFAVIPEPTAMGEQAAGLIFDLEEAGWTYKSVEVLPPISVYSVLNLTKLLSITNVRKSEVNLDDITKILTDR